MPQASILILAKYPQAGQVKTRLVPPLSPEQAAQWHKASLRAVCERTTSCMLNSTQSQPYTTNVILVGAPDSQLHSFRKLQLTGIDDYWPQGNGDLGQRLARVVDRTFSGGTDAVVLLGADSPTLPLDYLSRSLSLLETLDAVMAPTHDGGYCLLSLRRPCPTLFDMIDWSTSAVAEQTRRQARLTKITLADLPPWYDIDSFDDLQKMLDDYGKDALVKLASAIALQQLTSKLVEQVQ